MGRCERMPIEKWTILANGIGACEFDQLANALCCLFDGPVISKTGDQGRHLTVRPAECKIVSVECVGDHFTCWHPNRHSRIVVQNLIQAYGEVSERRLGDLAERAAAL